MNKIGQWFAAGGLLVSFAIIIAMSCAEVAPPPGGPVDNLPPQIVSTLPADGSVNVPRDNRIVIQFSERIVEPTSGKFVFISPRPLTPPDIDVKSDRIEIMLADDFDSNQTYLVTLGSSIADLRNNRLDSSITIAFSTGGTLDSGRISGNVYHDMKPQSGALVALFHENQVSDTTSYDSLPPAYLISSGQDGYFSFSYLPPENYRLIAFLDENRNEFLDPGEEPFGVPDRPCDLTRQTEISGLYVPLTRVDTLPVSIVSAGLNNDQLLRLRLSKPIALAVLSANPAAAALVSLEDTTRVWRAVSFAESGEEEASTIHLLFDTLTDGLYRVELGYDGTKPPLTYDSLELKLSDDRTPPEIAAFTPGQPKVVLRDARVKLLFSEPIIHDSIGPETFLLWEDGSTPVAVARQWNSPFSLSFVGRLRPGHNYRLDVTEFDIMDRAFNMLGDSLRTYAFGIYDPDSLGSVSGDIIIADSAKEGAPVVLAFESSAGDFADTITVQSGTFSVALPSGRYLIRGFIDSDRNGEISNGSLFPYRLSETRAVYPDTVAVRARFETAGIEFEFK